MIDRIQRLTLDELPDCLALAQDRDWLPEEHKWRLLFDVGTVPSPGTPERGATSTTPSSDR